MTDSAQIRLAPLLRAEALYLLGDIAVGSVVVAKDGRTTHQAGFHAVDRGELVILTVMTAELEALLDNRMPITYLAEFLDDTTGKGWYATFTGPAGVIADPALQEHYHRVVPGFQAGPGTRVIVLSPQLVDGHRFQRLAASPQ
jgi:hypothetical protein